MLLGYLLSAIVIGIASLLAQTSGAATDVTAIITMLNIGLAGVGLIAFAKRWIVPGGAYTEAVSRELAKEEEIQHLRKLIEEQIIPELTRSKDMQTKMLDLTGDFIKLIDKHH